MLDRVKRHVHSADYAQKERDMAFVKQVFPKLSSDQIFRQHKKEYLSARDERRHKASAADPMVGLNDETSRGLKK